MRAFDAALIDPLRIAVASSLPVIGYLANTVPVEMIRAAGGFAQQVTGSPSDETPDALTIMEDFSDGWSLSVFQQWLDGRLDHLEAIVVPRSSEAMLQLYYHMQNVMYSDPGASRPKPILFDILHTPFPATARYNAGRMQALRERLSAVTGQDVKDAALAAAIQEANAVRDALFDLNSRRIAGSMNGSEMWRLTRASTQMSPGDFLSACAALPESGAMESVGARLLLTGSPHDSDGFHRLVEDCGARITGDDHMAGDWWFLDPVGLGEPMQALVEKYHLHAPSPRSFPHEVCDTRVLAAAERARAEAVIFFADARDDALGFDYPTQRDLLAERGLQVLFMPGQDYRAPDRADQRAKIGGFLKGLKVREGVA